MQALGEGGEREEGGGVLGGEGGRAGSWLFLFFPFVPPLFFLGVSRARDTRGC